MSYLKKSRGVISKVVQVSRDAKKCLRGAMSRAV